MLQRHLRLRLLCALEGRFMTRLGWVGGWVQQGPEAGAHGESGVAELTCMMWQDSVNPCMQHMVLCDHQNVALKLCGPVAAAFLLLLFMQGVIEDSPVQPARRPYFLRWLRRLAYHVTYTNSTTPPPPPSSCVTRLSTRWQTGQATLPHAATETLKNMHIV